MTVKTNPDTPHTLIHPSSLRKDSCLSNDCNRMRGCGSLDVTESLAGSKEGLELGSFLVQHDLFSIKQQRPKDMENWCHFVKNRAVQVNTSRCWYPFAKIVTPIHALVFWNTFLYPPVNPLSAYLLALLPYSCVWLVLRLWSVFSLVEKKQTEDGSSLAWLLEEPVAILRFQKSKL